MMGIHVAARGAVKMISWCRANRTAGLVILVALASFVLHGCSDSSTPIRVDTPLDPTQDKLIKIGKAYRFFLEKQHKPPQSWADLKPILAASENADEPWRSPRDGQPLVICWGVDLSKKPDWAKSTPVLAYEKQGTAGSRFVLTTARSVELLADKEFQEASFPPGQVPGN
jgi:hypothetical protein